MNSGVNFVVTITTSLSKKSCLLYMRSIPMTQSAQISPIQPSNVILFGNLQVHTRPILPHNECPWSRGGFQGLYHSITALIRDFPFANVSCIFFTSKNRNNMYMIFLILYESDEQVYDLINLYAWKTLIHYTNKHQYLQRHLQKCI